MERIVATLLSAFLLSSPARADDASGLFGRRCAVCHGEDGKGSKLGQKLGVKDLTATSLSVSEVAALIAQGKPEKKMPGYKDKIAPDQIDALARYVKNGLR